MLASESKMVPSVRTLVCWPMAFMEGVDR